MTRQNEVPIPEGMIGFARAAQIIGCNRDAVHKMHRRGEIHAIWANGQWWTTPPEAKQAAERKHARGKARKGPPQADVLEESVAEFLEADRAIELAGTRA